MIDPETPGAAARSSESDEVADVAMGRYADGEDDAFVVLHRAVAPRLRAFLIRLARSPSLADDLLQETLLRVHRARGSFARGARALPWCYAIARNVYIDHVRLGSVRRERLSKDDEDADRDVTVAPDADGEAIGIARELARKVERTLSQIPQNQREAFILLRYEGLSVREASEVLGTTEGAVKLRAFHAYEALRAALGTDAPTKRGAS